MYSTNEKELADVLDSLLLDARKAKHSESDFYYRRYNKLVFALRAIGVTVIAFPDRPHEVYFKQD